MAASPTPRPTPADVPAGEEAALRAALLACDPPLPLAIAFSGGADSTALLLAAVRAFPGQVRALHVHHGLQVAADQFQAHCEALCAALGLPLSVLRVQAGHAPGQSPEDAARRARYAALARGAREQGAACVALGQHADDQAETLLLALSRGAGLPGLAAMPRRFEREGMAFCRPFLALPGESLRRWLRAEGVAWVEDPTNQDPGFTRNRIRLQLMPALQAAFPGFRDTFARSARHAAQAAKLLEEVAAADLAAMQGAPRIAGLQALSRERQANVLRHWLRAAHGAAASAAQLDELLDQVQACRTRGHRVSIKVGAGLVVREGAELAWRREALTPTLSQGGEGATPGAQCLAPSPAGGRGRG